MFDEKQLAQLDSVYFNIITLDDRDVTIQSRNTGHYWYLHCTEYPTEEPVSYSINIDLVIRIISTVGGIASTRQSEVLRAMINGR